MSTNAAFAHEPASHQPRGQHVHGSKHEVAIRVLACPSPQLRYPHHARATFLAQPEQPTQPRQSLSGVAYNLSKSERRFALAAGVVFTAISFAAVLL